jgi:mono/diheme cytochrome c family protein
MSPVKLSKGSSPDISAMIARQPVSSFAMRVGLLLGLTIGFASSAQQLTPAQSDFFESKIRPILVKDCYNCHSQQAPKIKGGLTLDTRDGWLKGGATGPAIVPGDPEKSLLIKAVRYTDEDLQMPPNNKKLSDAEIASLVSWVKMGAPDPRVVNAGGTNLYATQLAKDHWAFKPIQNPPVPDVADTNWIKTPVDAFILAKLEENGLKPNPIADKRTLLRRATFDLIGLPPTQEEIKDFLNDDSPDAFAKVVDRLLASPHYGERWGRFWLDTARYADTKGQVNKNKEDSQYPYAWAYRDYVVRAFNEDMPFTKFIVEQIAADKISINDRGDLAAMGFLTLGERFGGNNNDIINDRIDVVTKGFLGLTVTCARCHDHKFDPIPTRDYYSLHGVFNSSIEMSPVIIGKVDYSSTNYIQYAKFYAQTENQLAALALQKKADKGDKQAVKMIANQEEKIRSDFDEMELTNTEAPARAMILEDSPKPKDSPIFIHGEAENRGDIAPREFLQVLSPPNRVPFQNGSGRLELALDIASKSNPLTARVIVNRIWMHHFDAGIVTTPDDLGNQSAPPSHPELLDYLATRFMADGWSIKKLHRLIMLSSTYQQSSADSPRYAQIDPENRLLWRANIRRMDFEEVRDSMLAIGGKLDETMYGRPVNLGSYPYSTRRTIYGYIDRLNTPEVYNQFDFANPEITMGKRYETIVPQQSLFLMNSPLVIEQARNLIDRIDFNSFTNDDARVTLLYELVYQREPTPVEIKLGLSFVANSPDIESVPKMFIPKQPRPKINQKLEASFASLPTGERKPLTPWEKYAHALLQANEAVFVN